MSVVRLSPEAIDELAEAAAWYRARRPGLEDEFLAEVDRVLPLIASSPASFPRLLDVPKDLVIRRTLLPRFPYAVILQGHGIEGAILSDLDDNGRRATTFTRTARPGHRLSGTWFDKTRRYDYPVPPQAWETPGRSGSSGTVLVWPSVKVA